MATHFVITGGHVNLDWDDETVEREWLDDCADPEIIERWAFAKGKAEVLVEREPEGRAVPVLGANGVTLKRICHVYLAFPNHVDAVEYRLRFGDETIEL